MNRYSRREFLAYGAGFAWFPFFRPKNVSLAGARFRIHRNGHSRRRYLLIHGNEETARQVLLSQIRSHEGIALEVQGTTRNVAIEGGFIDPNRMFSRAGAEASLKRLNPDWPPERIEAALRTLDKGREKLVRAIFPPDGGLVVALHNNTDYSVNDELENSDSKSIKEPRNPHAFYLCTNPADYQVLAESGYNAVLQSKPLPVDDGSLSRLATAREVRYVNLEVALGDYARQKEMLEWLDWKLA